jgi:hypothetical protein
MADKTSTELERVYTIPLRKTKLINFTPQKVTSYINYWNSLFH